MSSVRKDQFKWGFVFAFADNKDEITLGPMAIFEEVNVIFVARLISVV